MANLKETILQSLKNMKHLESTLNVLSISQENLLKNHANPVFNKKNKEKILKGYGNLEDIGKSLYRYNTLQKNNLDNEAKEEKHSIETKVLKTGISYNKYIWHAENGENTCEVCASLDGKEFDFYDEVPKRPHPNCKCYVEIIDYSNQGSTQETNENEESCNAIIEMEITISNMEIGLQEMQSISNDAETELKELENDALRVKNLIQEVNSSLEILEEEYGKHLPECENNIDAEYESIKNKKITLEMLLEDIKRILDMGWVGIGTFIIFISNYVALLYRAYILKQYEMDKYYHSKANCEAVQAFGELGEEAAILLSEFKEKFDQYENIYANSHKVTIEEAIADSERDHEANRLGRERARQYPNCKCYELMSDLKPKHKK